MIINKEYKWLTFNFYSNKQKQQEIKLK